MIKKLFILPVLLITHLPICFGQSAIFHADCTEEVRQIRQWYDEGAYLLVLSLVSETTTDPEACNDTDRREAELLSLLSRCYVDMLSDRNLALTSFAIETNNSIQGTEATEYLLQELTNQKDWHAARHWFEKPNYFPTRNMDKDAWYLAYGYTLFNLELFDSAIQNLSLVSSRYSRYHQPALYYMALSYDRKGDWQKAVDVFSKMELTGPYRRDIPYFIGQLLYKNEQGPALMTHAENFFHDNDVNPELYRLAGMEAFAQDDHQRSARFMKAYIEQATVVSEDDYYLLAYSLYRHGELEEAESNFEKIAHLENRLGQLANYYLGAIKLDHGDKVSARNAYLAVSRYDHDSLLAEQAYFLYGKLSAELHHDHEAVIVMREYGPESEYFEEAQVIIRDILLHTNNFNLAIQILEDLEYKSEKLKQAEHRILYWQAMEWINNGHTEAAMKQLEVVSNRHNDRVSQRLAKYWLAELYFRKGHYERARDDYQNFLIDAVNEDRDLITHSHYGLGYICLKEKDYKAAIDHFAEMLTRFDEHHPNSIDAQLRIADCYLKINDYEAALFHYNTVLESVATQSVDYALYQKATIEGLLNQPFKKLLTLETLIDLYDNSRYLDDAVFETGVTLHNLSKPHEAIKSFQYLVDQYANSSSLVAPALIRLGLISYNLGDLKQAADYYKLALKEQLSQDQKKACYTALKEIYVNDLARPDAYITIVESHSNQTAGEGVRDSLSFQAAQHQFMLGNFDRAIESFELYLDRHENGQFTREAHLALSDSYLELEDYKGAYPHLVRLCELGGSDLAEACFNAAEIAYHYQSNYDQALNLYQSAADKAISTDQQIKSEVGLLRCAENLSQDSLMMRYGQKILEYPKIDHSEVIWAHYCLATAFRRTGRAPDAITHYNYVTKHSGSEIAAESRFQVAAIYFDKGQFSLAEKICDKANKMNTNYPFWVAKGLILYSDILLELGDYFNARGALDAVIEHYTDSEALVIEAINRKATLDKFVNERNKLKQ